MIKKIISIILVLSLMITSMYTNITKATDIPQAMQNAYLEIAELRALWGAIPVTGYDIDVWNEYNILVLDIPGTFPGNLATIREDDGSANDYNSVVGEYRYIGENPDSYLVNNPKYPDDHSGIAIINSYDWQENNDKFTNVNQYITNQEDKEFYEKEIFYFLESEYGVRFDETADAQSWLDNAIVIVPPTSTGDGVIKFMHKWDSNSDGVPEDWYITVNLRSKNEAMNSVVGVSMESAFFQDFVDTGLDIDENIDLRSGQRGKEEFIADQAIPTGEDLYASIRVSEYIHDISYTKDFGKVVYSVKVSKDYYLRRWDDDAIKIDGNGDGDYLDPEDTIEGDWVRNGPHTVTGTYSVNRVYEYYKITNIDIYNLDIASIENEALLGGVLQLDSKVIGPEIRYTDHSSERMVLPFENERVNITLPSETIGRGSSYPSLPEADFESDAEDAVSEIQVRNDYLRIGEDEILGDGWADTNATAPIEVPEAPLNAVGDLYKEELKIPEFVSNGLKETIGSVSYSQYFPNDEDKTKTFPLSNLEDVFIHTPVVCYPKMNDVSRQNQLVEKDELALQLIIEETFHVDYPTQGEHLNALGYGRRDYESYIKVKQVQFPFDVYVGTGYDGLYLPKNTWGNFNLLENRFFIPSWVEEGGGHVLFRTLAENIADVEDEHYEFNANLNEENYKAVEARAVNVSGKINQFTITGCSDDFWKNNFQEGNKMYAGENLDNLKAIEKEGVILSLQNILPLMPGKEYINELGKKVTYNGVMLGYPIDFTIQTNGDYQQSNDMVQVVPRFDFVPVVSGKIDMTKRQPVDVYISEYNGLKLFDGNKVLTEENREFIGDTKEKEDGISNQTKKESIQEWKDRFFLPNMTYVVPQGTNLSTYGKLNVDQAPFLHQGYIVVNFDIYVYDNLEGLTKERLKDSKELSIYLNSQKKHLDYGVGWSEEGYLTNQLGNILETGDIIFYSTDRRASTTYY